MKPDCKATLDVYILNNRNVPKKVTSFIFESYTNEEAISLAEVKAINITGRGFWVREVKKQNIKNTFYSPNVVYALEIKGKVAPEVPKKPTKPPNVFAKLRKR